MALAVLLLVSQPLTCMAADEPLTISNAQADPGEYVYLTVTLNKAVTADSIGIRYKYNTDHLKADPDLSQWGKTGLLSDFDVDDDDYPGIGVWAGTSSEKLQGKVCVLAFKVLEKAAFTKTEITCEVTFKDGSQVVGEFSATGIVSATCNHSYGPWKTNGLADHERSCEKCGDSYVESHAWDSGVFSKIEGKPELNLLTYTCTVCKQTKEQQVPADSMQEELAPPENDKVVEQNKAPGQQTQKPAPDNQGSPADDHTDHTHEDPLHGGISRDEIEQDPTYLTDDTDHDHDNVIDHTGHNHNEPQGNPLVNFIIIFVVVAAAVVAAVLFLKKKR